MPIDSISVNQLPQASGNPSLPIVGIGASAGGLEAFQELLRHLPVETGMAYVFVQHLDPTHESLLTPLLARATQMVVHEIKEEGQVLRPNEVYVIAPNTDLLVDQGMLTLRPRTESHGQHLSINTFFRSLAENRASQAIGVLLSGMASDGTAGLQAIKDRGGTTLAQDTQSARSSMMPQSAIATGCVDFIGSPEEIARELTRISRHSPLQQSAKLQTENDSEGAVLRADEQALPEPEQAFGQILGLLRQKMGVDFTAYKPTMLQRRIQRRMQMQQIDSPSEYVTMLHNQQAEVEALYQDLLIGVTRFFRDPFTYSQLTGEVFPLLIEAKSPLDPIRLWVAGCSTGEEVYSLAICLQEFLAEHADTHSIQLFGTDLNPRAIAQARSGRYSLNEVTTLSPTRLERFFHPIGGQYQINKSIRDLCVFALHDLLHDPPFSRLDLILCQNVLIYLQATVQQKLVQIFRYALAPEGILVLGPSETIRATAELFTPVGEHKHQLYRKKATSTQPSFVGPISGSKVEPSHRSKEELHMRYEESTREGTLQKEVDHLLLDRYAPAGLVVDAEMEICHFRGPISPYLEPMSGKASLNLFKMVREELRLELRTALHQARKGGHTVKKAGIQLNDQNLLREFAVEVIPLKDLAFLILFTQAPQPTNVLTSSATTKEQPTMARRKQDAKEQRIQHLEQELVTKREEMRSIVEELEATNEELQSANEEMLSSNEELQSLNEELETSKEEIQASNEELLTINQELKQNQAQLQEARTYAEAIVETIREPLLVLNADLCVQSANPAFSQFFQIEPGGIEQQRLFDLDHGLWDIPALRTLMEKLLPNNHAFADYEVDYSFPRIGRKSMLLNARRIDHVPLILLALEDITERKLAQQRVQQSLQAEEELTTRLRALLEAADMAILFLAADGRVQELNHRFTEFFGPASEALSGASFEQLCDDFLPLFESEEKLSQCFQRDRLEQTHSFLEQVVQITPQRRELIVQSYPVFLPSKLYLGHLYMLRDITKERENEQFKNDFASLVYHELRTPLTSIRGFVELLLEEENDQAYQEHHEFLTTIQESVNQLMSLVNDLLDIARLEAGKMDLGCALLNIEQLCRKLATAFEPILSAKKQQLTLEFLCPEPVITGDEQRLYQVISNLLSNASKYTPEGGSLCVWTKKEQDRIRVGVQDTGIGMTLEEQENLFSRFYRVRNHLTKEISGTGLGLTITRSFIELHGGHIQVESAPGKGSTFSFTLPLDVNRSRAVSSV